MKIGTTLGLLSPKYYEEDALPADSLAFESLWMPEHLVFPMEMSGSPFPGQEHPPVPPNIKLFDVFAFLSWLAAKTEQIRLGTNVYLLGLRHPFIAARAVATLDWVSGGRAEVGVGAGWLRTEWEATGLDPATRGRRLDEALAVCKRLWTEEVIAHNGEFYQFNELMFEPKPVQQPHPPVLIGGESPAALRRIVELGDGWYGIGHSLKTVQPVVMQLKELCEAKGRDFSELEITTSTKIEHRDELEQWREAGVTRLVIQPWQRGSDAVSELEKLAQKLF